MIKAVDKKTEKYLFNVLPESLVPFEATVRDGELTVEYFRKVKKAARQFYNRFKEYPFSDEAIEFIDSALKDEVEEWGYFTDNLREGHIVTFVANGFNDSLILDSTRLIPSGEGYENLTEYELEPLENGEVYCVTVLDGKIVSVCEPNASDAFIGAKEINVYTVPEYRGKGYAVSNVSAMIRYYQQREERVAYTSVADNAASIKTAERCGLKKIAETFYYVCYKKEG